MAGGGKHRGTGVRVTRWPSEPEENSDPEESGGREPTPGAPRQSAEREEPALAEASTSQSAIEIAVEKVLKEALPQALSQALPVMAEALKAMLGEKPKGDAAKPTGSGDDESDKEDEEEGEESEMGLRRAGKAKMPSENEDKSEESRQGLERAQSLLGGGPGLGGPGTRAVAPAAISPLGELPASRPGRGNPMRARKFPILNSLV